MSDQQQIACDARRHSILPWPPPPSRNTKSRFSRLILDTSMPQWRSYPRRYLRQIITTLYTRSAAPPRAQGNRAPPPPPPRRRFPARAPKTVHPFAPPISMVRLTSRTPTTHSLTLVTRHPTPPPLTAHSLASVNPPPPRRSLTRSLNVSAPHACAPHAHHALAEDVSHPPPRRRVSHPPPAPPAPLTPRLPADRSLARGGRQKLITRISHHTGRRQRPERNVIGVQRQATDLGRRPVLEARAAQDVAAQVEFESKT